MCVDKTQARFCARFTSFLSINSVFSFSKQGRKNASGVTLHRSIKKPFVALIASAVNATSKDPPPKDFRALPSCLWGTKLPSIVFFIVLVIIRGKPGRIEALIKTPPPFSRYLHKSNHLGSSHVKSLNLSCDYSFFLHCNLNIELAVHFLQGYITLC